MRFAGWCCGYENPPFQEVQQYYGMNSHTLLQIVFPKLTLMQS